MTLAQALEMKGYATEGRRKCICPFHDDNSPSAIINDNNIFCFACYRVYTIPEIEKKLGVQIDKSNVASVYKKPEKIPMFRY